MTLQELYNWAEKRGLTDLPLYIGENSYAIYDDEVELSGCSHETAEDEGLYSVCCSAPPIENTDLCSECREHSEFSEALPERIFLKV